ncbi:MAG: McrC family protein [Spirochaetaceae bacterium]|nr:McrC family protein [Spirochaetaceae bacterium]
MPTPRVLVVREHEPLTGLREDERRDLERFALARSTDERGRRWPVLSLRNGRLHAQNYVGIIETRRGTVIEILPKVGLSDDGDGATTISGHAGEPTERPPGSISSRDEDTRRVFLTMLRDWRGLGQAQLDGASIRAIRRFDMFEALVHLFLVSVVLLTRRGLARAYRTQEANLPCLRGRILFSPHVRENLVDRSRFYVGYDEFTADRPANRLIHSALRRLAGIVRHPENRQRVHQLRIVFSDVPLSTNLDDDWARRRVDRSMRHYDTVMPWVGLFLFGHGLATFAGPHVNRALLFPMEEVFEDFVTAAVRRHQRRFTVRAQGPMWQLATDVAGKDAFRLKPDVVLFDRKRVRFILDAKWKPLDLVAPNRGVSQDDAYQLFAYGKRYGCRRVVLVYPRTKAFRETLLFRFADGGDLEMACFPFNVADPAGTVGALMRELTS